MPLGWKVLQSYGDKIISNHRRYSYFTDSYRDTYWTIGVWQHVHGVIEPCRNGLHMSPTPGAAWAYVHGDILALVEGASPASLKRLLEHELPRIQPPFARLTTQAQFGHTPHVEGTKAT